MNARDMLALIIGYETGNDANGGFTNTPGDLGGPTMWGIASNFNPEVASKIIDRSLTLEEATNLYLRKYWEPLNLPEIVPDAIKFILLDSRIHGTFQQAVEALQLFLSLTGSKILVPDGRLGPVTRAACDRRWTPSESYSFPLVYGSLALKLAPEVAKNVLRKQAERGMQTNDFTRGFEKRAMWRARTALDMA